MTYSARWRSEELRKQGHEGEGERHAGTGHRMPDLQIATAGMTAPVVSASKPSPNTASGQHPQRNG